MPVVMIPCCSDKHHYVLLKSHLLAQHVPDQTADPPQCSETDQTEGRLTERPPPLNPFSA